MKKEIIKKYISLIILLAVFSSVFNLKINAEQPMLHILSEAVILVDADTGQILYEKNMHAKMYPASITKVMTALLALELGNMNDVITMSHDAVFSIGRDTSNIALDVNEQLTLEQALYAVAIESGNDASNGVAELISETMEDFAKLMTKRAKELGALNTNFTNAHGLSEALHYTSAYDMAKIMTAAIKTPDFNKIFSTILYEMPPTNRQEDMRTFNRRNSLIEGPNKYDGVIAEKTGWTGASGHTYVAAASHNGRTLVAVVMKSPDAPGRWEDCKNLFDYGFGEFTSAAYNASEFAKHEYILEDTDGTEISLRLIPDNDFNFILVSPLKKEDTEIKYIFYENDGKINGKAIFLLKPGVQTSMFTELGEVNLQVYFNISEEEKLVNSIISTEPQSETESSLLSKIYRPVSVILQITGILAIIYLLLYIRKWAIIEERKRKKKRQNRRI